MSYHCKKLWKKDIKIIFFQWELRLSIRTCQIWHLGDRGGTHIRHIWLSNNIPYNRGIFPILNKECFTKSKMSLPQVPPQSPKCQIWKVWSLRLSAFTKNKKKLCWYLFSIIFYNGMKFRCLVWYLRDYFKLKIKWSHQLNTRPN